MPYVVARRDFLLAAMLAFLAACTQSPVSDDSRDSTNIPTAARVAADRGTTPRRSR